MLRSAALAVLALCLSASGASARPGPGLLMATPRQQAIDIAKNRGFLRAGSSQKLQYRTLVKPAMGTPGKAEIKVLGIHTVTRTPMVIASVKAKLFQGREGWGVVKTGTWQVNRYGR